MTRGIPMVMLGDWNLDLARIGKLARQLGAELVPGRHPDHALVRDFQVCRIVRARSRHGSDHHHPIVLTVELRGGELVTFLYWNVYVGQAPKDVAVELAKLIDAHAPHVVQLSEAYRCRRVLGQVPGYRRLQGLNIGEGADVALLVRRDVRVVRQGTMVMRLGWVGPHGKRRTPRIYRAALLELRTGARMRVLGIHLPPGAGVNAPAVAESLRRLARWGNRWRS